MKLKVLLTGATGMVGEGVLQECLLNPDIEEVLIINRRPSGMSDPKLKEFILKDFSNPSSLPSNLGGYDACYFCLGVSSVGMKNEVYHDLTYTLTLNFANALATQNPKMVVCYVSGANTDSTEKGRVAWARVKGKTENDLMKLFPGSAYNFRPGIMVPTPGAKHVLPFYKYFKWLIPVIKLFSPNSILTLRELGLAMIHVTTRGYPTQVLEIKDIHALAKD